MKYVLKHDMSTNFQFIFQIGHNSLEIVLKEEKSKDIYNDLLDCQLQYMLSKKNATLQNQA